MPDSVTLLPPAGAATQEGVDRINAASKAVMDSHSQLGDMLQQLDVEFGFEAIRRALYTRFEKNDVDAVIDDVLDLMDDHRNNSEELRRALCGHPPR